MIAHTSVSVTDLAKSKELYTMMLAPLGYTLEMDLEEYGVAGFKQAGKTDFWLGKRDDASGGIHVAFATESKEQVDAFYEAALAAGAIDNGAPGIREDYSPGYYAAFVLDLNGNNIEVVWMNPAS